MTIRLRRWTILLAATSVMLGSCSDPVTTDLDLDTADEDPEEPAPAAALAELPMDGVGWLLFQAVIEGDVVDLGLVRPDGSGPRGEWAVFT
jgi:hypothetical protein